MDSRDSLRLQSENINSQISLESIVVLSCPQCHLYDFQCIGSPGKSANYLRRIYDINLVQIWTSSHIAPNGSHVANQLHKYVVTVQGNKSDQSLEDFILKVVSVLRAIVLSCINDPDCWGIVPQYIHALKCCVTWSFVTAWMLTLEKLGWFGLTLFKAHRVQSLLPCLRPSLWYIDLFTLYSKQ